MIAIKKVYITPNAVNVGELIFISIKAKDIAWEDLKADFSNWKEINDHFINWNYLKNYNGVK
jgi:hypothetical protein